MDILDSEASEDEAARKGISINRVPSHQANVDLIEKELRYRTILAEAAASDESVRQKWDEWEESITQLTWNEVNSIFFCSCAIEIELSLGGSGGFCTFFDRDTNFPCGSSVCSESESCSFIAHQIGGT